MLLKSAFVVAATFCLVQFACASPAVARSKRQAEDSSDEELTGELVALYNYTLLLVTEVVPCEILALAANIHCHASMVTDNLESDRRNHVVANSFGELLEDLRTMEQTQEVFIRVLASTPKPGVNVSADMWFEALDKAIAEDPMLSQRYKELKSSYEKLVVLEPDHLQKAKLVSDEEQEKALEKSKPAQELIVSMIFLDRLSGDDEDQVDKDIAAKKLKFRALARTIQEMSKSVEKYEKLQPIYKESISAVATMGINDSKLEEKDAASLLYRQLKKKIKADPLLGAEFKEKKKEMLKKLKEKA